MPDNREERKVVTLPDRIRRLAEDRGARPAQGSGDGQLRIRRDPDTDERITWNEFFDRFDPTEQAVYYRSDAAGDDLAVVDRRPRDHRGSDAAPTENPDDVETETLATSDTGDAEPVVFQRTESERADRDTGDDPSTAGAADAERTSDSAASDLVLDEIHEARAGSGGGEHPDEYLVFENTGDQRIDLSGWTVENADGRTYHFPAGTVLEAGERVTLHGGAGEDGDGHRYWNADEPLWDTKDIAVTVRTDAGEPVLRERYET